MAGDAVKQAERIVRRAGRFAPTDGGRGREFRRRWTLVRWFSWRTGMAGHRGRKWWVCTRWSIASRDVLLWGVESYEDEDGDRYLNVGFWPFHWETVRTYMPRPKDTTVPAPSPEDGT